MSKNIRRDKNHIPKDSERGWRFEIWSEREMPSDERIGFKIRSHELCMRYLQHLDIVGMQCDEEDKLIYIKDSHENRYLNGDGWDIIDMACHVGKIIDMACHVGKIIDDYLEGHAEHGNWVNLSPKETSAEDLQRALPQLIISAYDTYAEQQGGVAPSQLFDVDKMLVFLANFGVSYYKFHPGGPHIDIGGEQLSWADFEQRIIDQVNEELRPKLPPPKYNPI